MFSSIYVWEHLWTLVNRKRNLLSVDCLCPKSRSLLSLEIWIWGDKRIHVGIWSFFQRWKCTFAFVLLWWWIMLPLPRILVKNVRISKSEQNFNIQGWVHFAARSPKLDWLSDLQKEDCALSKNKRRTIVETVQWCRREMFMPNKETTESCFVKISCVWDFFRLNENFSFAEMIHP